MRLVDILKAFQILETSVRVDFFFFIVYLSPHRLMNHPPNPISSVISPSEVVNFDKLHERSTFHRYDRIVITYQPSLLSLLIPTLESHEDNAILHMLCHLLLIPGHDQAFQEPTKI